MAQKVDSISLQQTLKDLDAAYQNFLDVLKMGKQVGFRSLKVKRILNSHIEHKT